MPLFSHKYMPNRFSTTLHGLVGGSTLAISLLIPVSASLAAAGVVTLRVGQLTPYRNEPGFYTTDILLDTTQPISAVTVKLQAIGLSYVDTDLSASQFPTILAPATGAGSSASLSLSRPGAGFSGNGGKVGTAVWKAIDGGTAAVDIVQDASLAGSNVTNTNVLKSVSGTTSQIASVSSSSLSVGTATKRLGMQMNTMTDEAGTNLSPMRSNGLSLLQVSLLATGLVSLLFGSYGLIKNRLKALPA